MTKLYFLINVLNVARAIMNISVVSYLAVVQSPLSNTTVSSDRFRQREMRESAVQPAGHHPGAGELERLERL